MITLKTLEIGHRKTLFSVENMALLSGKMYALIGANGVGKSTFLQSITGVLSPISGSIEIAGIPVLSLGRIERAKQISFVGSKFDGVDFLKVKEYVALGRTPYTNALGRLTPNDWDVVNEAISTLKLETLQNNYTTELSDGERQLTAIARAIAQQTKVVLLDEPTAFLDYANRKKVMELMKTIALNLNKCVIVSSHDLELCLESEIDLLVVDKRNKKLVHFLPGSLSKDELIELGF